MAAPGPPAAFAAMIGAMKAKDDPKYAGTCHFVMMRKAIVASPLEIKAMAGFNPTKKGTSIVAPNIANKCCKLNVSQWAGFGTSFISRIGLCIPISPLHFIKKPSLPDPQRGYKSTAKDRLLLLSSPLPASLDCI
jgi:hypothetical protein